MSGSEIGQLMGAISKVKAAQDGAGREGATAPLLAELTMRTRAAVDALTRRGKRTLGNDNTQ